MNKHGSVLARFLLCINHDKTGIRIIPILAVQSPNIGNVNNQMTKMSIKRNLAYVVGLMLIGSIIGIYIMNSYVNDLNQEYSIDIRDEGNIKARVIDITPWHGVVFVHLSNDKKYWIDNSRNYNYDHIFIDDNIKIGDSIIKKDNSDSLLIKSSKGEFIFVVGEWINKAKD